MTVARGASPPARDALLLVAAGVAAWTLPRALGLTPGDALFGTVAIVPVVVAGLGIVEGAAVRRGARAMPRRIAGAQVVAVIAWLVLTAARARLDLPLASALAAALFALLGIHLLTVLPRLRPLLGHALPARPHAVFFFLPLLAYLAILPWSTAQRPPDGDEPYYLLVTHSIAYDLDADLTNQYAHGDSLRFLPRRLEPQPGDPVGKRGERYSRHNAVLPLLLALPYRLAGARGAFATLCALTAALAWQTLRIARHGFARWPGGALLTWALIAFAPPLLLYSHQIWVEIPAALLVLLTLDALAAREPEQRLPLRFWLFLVLLPLLKLRFAAFAGLLAALAWWRSGRRTQLLMVLTVGLAFLFAAILLFNALRFGSPLKSYGLEQLLPDAPLKVVLARGLGLFFDAAFGLFGVAPLWALLLPALLGVARRRERGGRELALLVAPYVLIVAGRREWYGGWSPPFRYGLVVLPLLALPLCPLLSRRRGGARLLLAGLGTATAAATLLWLAVPGWTYNFADGSTRLLSLLGETFHVDATRFVPSAIRLRSATWWWPLLTLLVVPLLWWRPRRDSSLLAAIGAAAALLAPAVAITAAARVPTHVIELEDAQVIAHGGGLYPPLWTFDRGRYEGGWQLAADPPMVAWVAAPVVPGGAWVRLRVRCQQEPPLPGPPRLEVRAGSRLLATLVPPPSPRWIEADLGPLPWPAGTPLVLALPAGSPPVVIDRVEFSWR